MPGVVGRGQPDGPRPENRYVDEIGWFCHAMMLTARVLAHAAAARLPPQLTTKGPRDSRAKSSWSPRSGGRTSSDQPQPEPQPAPPAGISPSAPSSTWNEWPQPHAEETFGLLIAKPPWRPSRKAISVPCR